MLLHAPVPAAHEVHEAPHDALAQQNPLLQSPVAHSTLLAHALPADFSDAHAPVASQ
jgi:hypothetical protein